MITFSDLFNLYTKPYDHNTQVSHCFQPQHHLPYLKPQILISSKWIKQTRQNVSRQYSAKNVPVVWKGFFLGDDLQY